MIAIEQVLFEALTQVGMPMDSHHIGEVIRADVNPPSVPIEKPGVDIAGTGQEAIPDVGVALNYGQVIARMIARGQARRCIEPTLIEFAPFCRKPVAEVAGEAAMLFRQT